MLKDELASRNVRRSPTVDIVDKFLFRIPNVSLDSPDEVSFQEHEKESHFQEPEDALLENFALVVADESFLSSISASDADQRIKQWWPILAVSFSIFKKWLATC